MCGQNPSGKEWIRSNLRTAPLTRVRSLGFSPVQVRPVVPFRHSANLRARSFSLQPPVFRCYNRDSSSCLHLRWPLACAAFSTSERQPEMTEGVPIPARGSRFAGEFSYDAGAKNGLSSFCPLSDSTCSTLLLWEPSSGSFTVRRGSGSYPNIMYRSVVQGGSAIQSSGANILATSGIFLYINASCPGPSDSRRCRRSLSLLAVAFQHVVCVLVRGHGHGAVPGFRLRASALRPT